MLFVFEGTDGVGKTTLIEKVASELRALGKVVVVLSDPSKEFDCTIGIREEVFKNKYRTEDAAVMFKAARLVLERHIWGLRSNPSVIILLDRYWPSTAIYQYEGVHSDFRREIVDLMTESINVTEYFLITDKPKNIKSRLESRNAEKNHYDVEDEEGIRYMQKQYRLLFKVMKLMDLGTFSEFNLNYSDETNIVERILQIEVDA